MEVQSLVTPRLESCSVLVTRASTRQHKKILISGTIGAFRSKKNRHSEPPPPQWDNTNLHSGGETIDSRVDACRVFRSSGSRRHHHRTRPWDVVVPLAAGEPGVTAGGARAFLPSAGNTRNAMAQLRRRRH